MDYYKVNYDSLRNIHQVKYYIVIIVVFLICIISIIASNFIYINVSNKLLGIYNNDLIYLKLERNQLSELLKNDSLLVNDENIKYEINKMDNYEIVDNFIYEDVYLTVDKKYINNTILNISIINKIKLIDYIFELFK